MLPYEIIGSVLGGAVVMFLVMSTAAWASRRHQANKARTDGGTQTVQHPGNLLEEEPIGPEDENPVVFTCEYHDKAFETHEEAYQHAIRYHNAPKDGETWKWTYPEGRKE